MFERQNQDFSQVFSLLFKGQDVIEIRILGDKTPKTKTFLHDKNEEIFAFVEKNADKNVYFGVNPRRTNKPTKLITRISACFVDIDSKDYPGEGVFEAHCEKTKKSLAEVGLAPAIIVDSGHGLHFYWPLSESPKIQETVNQDGEYQQECQEWRDTQEKLIAFCGGDPVIKDLPRIMRLPGSQNVKKTPHVHCRVISCVDRKFNLSDFEVLPAPAPISSTNMPSFPVDLQPDATIPYAEIPDSAAWIDGKLREIRLMDVIRNEGLEVRKEKNRGGNITLCCPYHDDKNPSSWISKNTNGVEMLHCSVCGCIGTALHIKKRAGKNFKQACTELFGSMPPSTCKFCGEEIFWQGKKCFDDEARTTKHKCKQDQESGAFWIFEKGEVKISHSMLIDWMVNQGFANMWHQENWVLVRVEGNLVSEQTTQDARDYAKVEAKRGCSEVYEKFCRGAHSYLDATRCGLIDRNPSLTIARDERDCAYFQFQNCLVRVSKDGIEMVEKRRSGLTWKKQVIHHSFQIVPYAGCDWDRFLANISRDGRKKDVNTARAAAIDTSIGYLLTNYRSSTQRQAVVLSENSDASGLESGRTGKGLFMRGVSKLRVVTTIDGKQIKMDSQFCWQQVTRETDIVFIDDLRPKFDFQSIYSALTEGFEVEKKNQMRFSIPSEIAPKFAVSTNYGVKGESGSDRARRFDVELGCYYDVDNTPEQEFGRRFFDDWSENDWNAFFCRQFTCLVRYYREGLLPYQSETGKRKRIMAALGESLLTYFESCNIKSGEYFYMENLFAGYTEEKISANAFSRKLREYLTAKGLKMQSERVMIDKQRKTKIGVE